MVLGGVLKPGECPRLYNISNGHVGPVSRWSVGAVKHLPLSPRSPQTWSMMALTPGTKGGQLVAAYGRKKYSRALHFETKKLAVLTPEQAASDRRQEDKPLAGNHEGVLEAGKGRRAGGHSS